MSSMNASIYDSPSLNVFAAGNSLIYKRDVANGMTATMEGAHDLGTLTTDKTQLNVKGQLSRENANHYYKFTLDGNRLKLGFKNNTDDDIALRIQVYNSKGTLIADSSSTADSALQTAYQGMTSIFGSKQKAGEYTIKTSFDATSLRAVPQQYSISLYSGTRFNASYQTTARSQTSLKQAVTVDTSMTYSLIDAKAYEQKGKHVANEKQTEAVNIGWMMENKTALAVTGRMTNLCKTQYYNLTLQRGDNLKMAFNNKTATADVRVQLYDSSGYKLYADSHGTKAQKEAYAKLTSATGIDVKPGQFMAKLTYAPGTQKNASDQLYDLKFYSGDYYSAFYRTIAATQTVEDALAVGRFTPGYTMANAAATYMTTMSQGTEVSIFDAFKTTA